MSRRRGNPGSVAAGVVALRQNLAGRQRAGRAWQVVFLAATVLSVLFLAALLYNVINKAFGLVAVQSKVDPAALAVEGVPLEELDKEQLLQVLRDNLTAGRVRKLDHDSPFADLSRDEVYTLVEQEVIKPEILESWTLVDSLLRRGEIAAYAAQEYPRARLQWRSWLNVEFLRRPQSATPAQAGVRTALLGSLWTILITIAVAFPLGVGAAIYLEEYAADNWLNRLIQVNISNLAGVPSIIYGMLGLTLFARLLEPLTSGTLLGLADPTTANGRTILSAGLTLALLILPLLIINAQEAIRAVPNSLRQGAYSLGATRWQMIWHHVLPNALPGILTGTILSISRAVGETAPLVVIGASTFVALDPSGPFSKFTALPMQIYQWTARPQEQFRNIAAAAIIVLLVLLLTLNMTAVLLRNRYRRRLP